MSESMQMLMEPEAVNVLEAFCTRPELVDESVPIAARELKKAGVRLPKHWQRRYRAVGEAQALARRITARIKEIIAEETLTRTRHAPA